MAEAFLTEREAADIREAKLQLFATAKLLGNSQSLQLWRYDDAFGDTRPVPAQEFLIVIASRESATERGRATIFQGADGELRKEFPADVQKGDSFTLNSGMAGKVTIVLPPQNGIVRAPFTLVG